MRTLKEIWYNRFVDNGSMLFGGFYIIGLTRVYLDGKDRALKKIERVADIVVLSFEGGYTREIPINQDMEFVYKTEEDADQSDQDNQGAV